MIKESKHCSDVMNKHFNKEVVMTKEDNEYVVNDVKVRDHCHITGKNRGSAYRGCNVSFKSNHKTYVVFHNLKRLDSYLIMQELGKFNLKINVRFY